ncbi:hypothetical protein NDU88_007561 [Pleurodeles waltl]|uniref:Uncharacterized protein n=1 Tax=Pleurodeles waltl TaxID=8319 RepID=A0AAV7WDX2_PLEWA|nr:hypothetical protein NDU88_007561 [Pleurodeles waltl]
MALVSRPRYTCINQVKCLSAVGAQCYSCVKHAGSQVLRRKYLRIQIQRSHRSSLYRVKASNAPWKQKYDRFRKMSHLELLPRKGFLSRESHVKQECPVKRGTIPPSSVKQI